MLRRLAICRVELPPYPDSANVVPKFLPDGTRNDVALVSLNHKMGNHGTTNALLNFGDGSFAAADEPGAVGYLVGQEHKGLA